jgi:hypothetical protein
MITPYPIYCGVPSQPSPGVYIDLTFCRRASGSTFDTFTGDIEILGLVVEYQATEESVWPAMTARAFCASQGRNSRV